MKCEALIMCKMFVIPCFNLFIFFKPFSLFGSQLSINISIIFNAILLGNTKYDIVQLAYILSHSNGSVFQILFFECIIKTSKWLLKISLIHDVQCKGPNCYHFRAADMEV